MGLRTLHILAVVLALVIAGCTAQSGPTPAISDGEVAAVAAVDASSQGVEIPEYPEVSAKTIDPGELDFKIGIMTGTVSQGEDEYRGAERVIARYGADKIIHRTYPDNFMTEQETTVTQLLEMAKNPEVKAIIVAQAVPGTLPAIKKARRLRDDLIFILVAPQEDPEQIAQYADLSLQTDDLMRGKTIVEQAAKMGAKTFVHYTFPRHMSM